VVDVELIALQLDHLFVALEFKQADRAISGLLEEMLTS
jgi:sporulation-control protein spo0M